MVRIPENRWRAMLWLTEILLVIFGVICGLAMVLFLATVLVL